MSDEKSTSGRKLKGKDYISEMVVGLFQEVIPAAGDTDSLSRGY